MAKGRRDFGSLRELRAQLREWTTQLLIALAGHGPEADRLAEVYAKKAAHTGIQILAAQEAYGK